MCGADGLVGASWPTVSTQPGNCSAFFSDNFVGYRLSFLSGLVFRLSHFPFGMSIRKLVAEFAPGLDRGQDVGAHRR